jgi:hypothetical protein
MEGFLRLVFQCGSGGHVAFSPLVEVLGSHEGLEEDTGILQFP